MEKQTRNLCDSCSQAVIVKFRNGKEFRSCLVIDRFFPNEEVVKCELYRQKNSMSLYEMKESALYIRRKKNKEGIGFKFLTREQNSKTDLGDFDD